MKNFIKLTLVMLFVCSASFVFSQTDTEVDTRIDNWRYWQEKAELGLIPFNPPLPPQPIIYYGTEGVTKTAAVDGPDILIVSGAGMNQSENSVFINPIDNQIALNGNNSFLGVASPAGANAMFTFDGGLTWTGGPSAPLSGNMGDPAMAIGLNGISYAGHISAGFNQGVNRSPDNGTTWAATTVATGPTLDKNHFWVDNSPVSPHEGNVYSAWSQLGGSAPNLNQIMITRSTNDGVTWSTPIQISSAVAAGSHNQGVNIQTGPAGEVYVVWAIYDSWPSRETALGFCMSTDGGVTFSTAVRIITNIKGIRGNAGTNATGKNQRVNSFPVMACDISGGPNNGDLYITWANEGVPGVNIGPDVSAYLIRSSDGGTTWDTPARINQDLLGNIHYFPWITSDPETGDLHTIFYDDRNVAATMVETWVASSSDGGTTWTEMRVSDVAFTPAPIPGMAGGYMGDYLGIAARGGQVYPVWTDNRTGQTLSYTSPFTCGCADDLIITVDVPLAGVDHQEAELTITASNDILSGGEAIYHAGDEVLLVDGFTSENGSAFRGYIEACTGGFVLSPIVNADGETEIKYVKAAKPQLVDFYDEKLNRVNLSVYPNPAVDIINVQLSQDVNIENFTVKIYSLSMGLVFVSQFTDQPTNAFQIDISEFESGVYMIELTDSETNIVYGGKVIKN